MNAVTKSRRIRLVVAASLMALSAVLTVGPSAQALPLKACLPHQCQKPPKLDKPLQACLEDCQPEPENDLPLDSCAQDCGGDSIDDFKDAPKDPKPEPPADPEPQAEPEPADKPQVDEASKPQPKAGPKADVVAPQVVEVPAEETGVPDFEIAASPNAPQQPDPANYAGLFGLAALALGLLLFLIRRRRQAEDDAVAALENM